jgi:hypothetical protein
MPVKLFTTKTVRKLANSATSAISVKHARIQPQTVRNDGRKQRLSRAIAHGAIMRYELDFPDGPRSSVFLIGMIAVIACFATYVGVFGVFAQ